MVSGVGLALVIHGPSLCTDVAELDSAIVRGSECNSSPSGGIYGATSENLQLEEQVKTHTAKLAEANEQLGEEIAERKGEDES